MISPVLLNSYVKSDEEYKSLFDEIVKKEADSWEEDLTHEALNLADEVLKGMRGAMEQELSRRRMAPINSYYLRLLRAGKTKKQAEILIHKKIKKESEEFLTEKKTKITDEYVKDLSQRFFLSNAYTTANGIKELMEKEREERIKKWKQEAKAKDKKILTTIPFDNIKCQNCNSIMNYQWSILINPPNDPTAEEKVLFFYICPKGCGKQAVFENGVPWISENNNNCAICNGKRSSTVTKDDSGNMYIIYECLKCKSRQVEKHER